jgi:hypothetical protein
MLDIIKRRMRTGTWKNGVFEEVTIATEFRIYIKIMPQRNMCITNFDRYIPPLHNFMTTHNSSFTTKDV